MNEHGLDNSMEQQAHADGIWAHQVPVQHVT